jgi:hypothetical protein
MSEYRRFRITDDDVQELLLHTHGEELFEAHSQWVKRVPLLDPLIQEITDAFEEVQLGDGIGLLEADGLDDYASDAERVELRSRDEKTDWRRIDPKMLNRYYVAPSYFDARGFVFHLPAFLIAELNDQYGYDFIDRLINFPRSPGCWHDLLTKPQCAVIIKTLKLVSEHPDYWEQSAYIEVAIEQLIYRPLSHGKPTTDPSSSEPLPAGYRISRSRIMYLEDKSQGLVGEARIGRVYFSKSGKTLYYRGRKFQSLKGAGFNANYFDLETHEGFWISGPRKDRSDRLYGGSRGVEIDEDVAEEYAAYLGGK